MRAAILVALLGCGSSGTPAGSGSGSGSAPPPIVVDARVSSAPRLGAPPTLDAAKVAAGKKLFDTFGKDTCLSCHGTPPGRVVPTLWNVGSFKAFGRDGHAKTLEDMVREMAIQFSGAPKVADDQVAAMTEYVRSIECRDTAYDRYAAGEFAALTDAQRRGYDAFMGKGECATCHAPPTFSTAMEREVYFTSVVPAAPGDIGREAVTKDAKDRGTFKPPTLRGVAKSGPFMHDGSVATLAETVKQMATPKLSATDLADIEAFLGALDCP